MPIESEQNFRHLIKKIRLEENIFLEQLAEGLMNVSRLARIEKGQRPVHKNMRDRLLGRLGVASELYENLLDIEDYAAWVRQQEILCAVEQQEFGKAGLLISEYEKQIPVKDKIGRQFCLVMQAEVFKGQKADRAEPAGCYEEAVKLTIPDFKHLYKERKLLSIQEINIVLEYEAFHENNKEVFKEKCKALMAYVLEALYDNLSKVKIYPKIVYYYLREALLEPDERMEENLQICGQAVEMLRDTGRACYLLELLEMKIIILGALERDPAGQEESRELAELLKKLYKENGVPVYMQDCAYLYRERGAFFIGDVLRIRRKMYGFTRDRLCDGVCSAKTLCRTEKMQASMQQKAAGTLLRRLGLSGEFQKARLVTNDRGVLGMRREMAACRNNRDIVKCRVLLRQMRERISLEIPENRQYLMELEASVDWMEGKIARDEFVAREKEALRCTLDTSEFYDASELYLTEMEVLCICKIIQGLEDGEKRRGINFLLHFYENYESYGKRTPLAGCISMYEYVMTFVASELGNLGDCRTAAGLDKKVIKKALKCRRICQIDDVLYDILWNEMEESKKNGLPFEKEKMAGRLRECILLSRFCRQTADEKFYHDKLSQS